jgi:phospholipase/carboxylesterase
LIPGSGDRVILALHGTGGDESDLVPVAKLIDPTASILSPRGKVNEAGANRFFRRFAEGSFDLMDLAEQTDDLADFVTNATNRFRFSPDKIIALGFSNGANIASSLMLRKPEILAGAILIRGMVPFEPSKPVDLKGKRAFLLNGRQDPIVTIENAERLAAILREGGAEVEQVMLETGHALTQDEVALARNWLSVPVA